MASQARGGTAMMTSDLFVFLWGEGRDDHDDDWLFFGARGDDDKTMMSFSGGERSK